MDLRVLLLLAIAIWFKRVTVIARGLPKPQLVVILLDGCRWDYLDLLSPYELGGFANFMSDGVRARYVESVFPAESLPAWTTLQTGLYPESHNIPGNQLYDSSTGITAGLRNATQSWWWEKAEPIWITATLQGLRAATIGWNRADVPFNGLLPEVASGYPANASFEDKISQVISHLGHGIDLVMMQHDYIDNLGHRHGPASIEVIAELRLCGRMIHRLFEYAKMQVNRVHLMLVSDHGFSNYCTPQSNLKLYYDTNITEKVVTTRHGAAYFYAKPGHLQQLMMQLQSGTGYLVVNKEDLPEEYHIKGASRAPDVFVWPEKLERSSGGCHGGDGRSPAMRTLLAAWGAAFAKDANPKPPLHLVDVYQLFAHVLRVNPRPHNGSWEAVRGMLSSTSPATRTHMTSHTLLCFVIEGILLVVIQKCFYF